MKKDYIKPKTDERLLSVEQHFLATQQSGASGENVTFDNESDFDAYFNN